MKQISAIGMCALTLTACASLNKPEDAGPLPTNYRQIIQENLKKYLVDPYSMRDVEISKPIPWYAVAKHGWLVCMRANTKNRAGGYTGLTDYSFHIVGGKVEFFMGRAEYICKNKDVKFDRWAEVEEKR